MYALLIERTGLVLARSAYSLRSLVRSVQGSSRHFRTSSAPSH